MEEIWKEIPDFPDYKISTLGNIMSKKSGDWVYLHPFFDNYMRVNLYNKNKTKLCGVHRLMGLTFLPNPDNLPTVDHIDRNETNNNLSNLRWATYKTQAMNRSFTRDDITETDPKKRQKICSDQSLQRIIDTKKYYCKICHIACQSQFKLDIHLDSPIHHRILNFKPTSELYCIPCGFNFRDKTGSDRHLEGPTHKKRMENIAIHTSCA